MSWLDGATRRAVVHVMPMAPWMRRAMQVCDLLMASGLSVRDSLLAELLHFPDFNCGEMRLLIKMAQEDVKAASRELLEGCVLYSGSRFKFGDRAPQRVTRTTRLISHASILRHEKGIMFRMQDNCCTSYLLTIPSLGKTVHTAYCLLCSINVMHQPRTAMMAEALLLQALVIPVPAPERSPNCAMLHGFFA